MAAVIEGQIKAELERFEDAGIKLNFSVESVPPEIEKPIKELEKLKNLLEKDFKVDEDLFPCSEILPSEALLYYQLSNKKNKNIKLVLGTEGFMGSGINHVQIYFNEKVFPVYDPTHFETEVLNHTMYAWSHLIGFGPGISICMGTPKQQYKEIMSYVRDVLNYLEKTPKEKIKAALELSNRMKQG